MTENDYISQNFCREYKKENRRLRMTRSELEEKAKKICKIVKIILKPIIKFLCIMLIALPMIMIVEVLLYFFERYSFSSKEWDKIFRR